VVAKGRNMNASASSRFINGATLGAPHLLPVYCQTNRSICHKREPF
jgi:hypothetical protein